MIAIKARKYGNGDQVKLSLRIKHGAYDNNTALNITIDEASWKVIEHNIKTAAEAYKLGNTILISDTLTSKLWNLIREFISMEVSGTLKFDSSFIANAVRNIMYSEEKKHAEESALSSLPAAKPTFVEFIEQYVHECENGERLKQKSSHKIAYGTLKGLRSFLARMKQYQEARKRIIGWDDLDMNFYNDFKQYYLDQKYSPNTIAGFIKKMKTILFAAKDLHLTTRDDFMSRKWFVGFEEVENIYIPTKRLMQMFSLNMSDVEDMVKRACRYAKNKEEEKMVLEQVSKPIRLRRLAEARDLFLMGCLTGQRVSDYKRISTDMIETIRGDRKFLHLTQTKTGKDVYVPYNEMMSLLLERYDGTMPMMCDQHLNRKIKVVGLLLGWTEPAGLTERRGVMEYKSDKRFCDAIMTHTARRTFATNAYKAGVPLSAIMAVTGHSSEEMLRRYLKLNTKERALLAAAEFDKVKSAL
jgi:integrase